MSPDNQTHRKDIIALPILRRIEDAAAITKVETDSGGAKSATMSL
jgi:hypothetical protein